MYMKLYKYVNSKRIDILTKGEIRFSQPSVWNDPFELQPHYKDNIPKNPWFQILKFASIISHFKKTNEVLQKEVEEFEKEKKRITKDDVYDFINRNILGLSLTEDKDSLLMWSHYASNHSGFVIEFDTNNDFFKNKDRHLFKVASDIRRPEVNTYEFEKIIINIVSLLKENKPLSETHFEKISYFFRKSIEWKYEKEWRLITTVNNASNYNDIKDTIKTRHFGRNSRINDKNLDDDFIAKFTVPSLCIRAIYCGKRMMTDNVRKLFFLTKYNKKFSHIKLKSSDIDDEFYKLNYKDISEYEILSCAEYMYEQDENKKKLKYTLSPYIRRYEKEKRSP